MNKFGKPRLNFISYPTKLQELHNLKQEIGCKQRIFIKRDDLTEMTLGGNKNRKLEYVMHEALDQKADCIVTWAGTQSNHIRQTIGFASKLGMEAHVVISGKTGDSWQGNRFLFDVLGAKIYYQLEEEKCEEKCMEIVRMLKEKGKNPYYVTLGASSPLGTIGYIDCAEEIADQAKQLGIKPGALFVASGSAGTQAGLEIGVRIHMPYCKVNGISVSRSSAAQSQKVSALINKTCQYISYELNIEAADICILDQYYGQKYAVPTVECVEAIKFVARTESILLDPVYSGKAMAGMLDQLKKGKLDHCESVVFVHTGGSPSLFNFTEYFK